MSQTPAAFGSSAIEDERSSTAHPLIGQWVADTLERWPCALRTAPEDEIAWVVSRILISDPALAAAIRRLSISMKMATRVEPRGQTAAEVRG
ncbi:MAG: hypothetical protein H6729_12610 [Deltaproteobacteria bacterium]|nr:hypothetical protein [Deltaproteobacteria bacterium]